MRRWVSSAGSSAHGSDGFFSAFRAFRTLDRISTHTAKQGASSAWPQTRPEDADRMKWQ